MWNRPVSAARPFQGRTGRDGLDWGVSSLLKLFGNKRLLILLAALIFFVAVMGITKGNRENITWPEKFVTDSISWMQGLLYRPAAWVAGFVDDIRRLRRLYEENKTLKRTIVFYERDMARLNYLEEENRRLKEALGFTERQKSRDRYIYRIARVVSRSTDALNNTIRIDLGSEDGVRENMAVVTAQGLVGRVVRVSPFYATVELLTNLDIDEDSSKAIAATVEGNESSFGIIQSYDRESGLFLMTKIRLEDPISEGDKVVTSGLGGVFPPGLVIGTVVTRGAGMLGTITHTALVRPAADFDPLSLREVFVVEVPEP